MLKRILFVAGVLNIALLAISQPRKVDVADITALNKAVASAKPGDVIVMQDGEWKDAEIDFNSIATEYLTNNRESF